MAECIGADVSWDQTTKTASLVRAGVLVQLSIGDKDALIGGTKKTLDVAPVIIENRTFLPLRFVAETFSQDVKWDQASKTVSITEDLSMEENSNMREWMLGCSAILAKVNNGNPYAIGMTIRTASSVKAVRASLGSQSWGVKNREDLLETIDSIANSGHSHNFDYDAALFKSLTAAEQKQILADAQGMDKYMWPMVMELDKKWGKKSIRAWDWFRVAHLCGWGYVSGYLTLEECYSLFEPTAQNLRNTFTSWDEASDNYLDGYAYWGRIDRSVAGNDFEKRYALYNQLKEGEKITGTLYDPTVWTEPAKGVN